MRDEADLRREMVRIGRLLYERQLIIAAEGNLSVALGGGFFLVTPAGLCKGLLAESDLLVVDAQGAPRQPAAGRPSSEWPLHREIYQTRPQTGAVCHAHPPWATAFAVAREPLDGCVLPEVVTTLGAVPLAAYATPGTDEVPRAARRLLAEGHQALLLANHGVVTLAADLAEAFFHLEAVERLAQVTLLARLLGGEQRLGAREVGALRRAAAASLPACRPDGAGQALNRRPAPPSEPGERGATAQLVLETLAGRIAGAILAELGRR